jgi:hypothetical protein
MNDTKELSCADRIADQLASEERNLEDIYRVIDNPEEQGLDDAYEELHSYALGIDARQETVITLSWGGPASYLEVTHRGAEIYTVVYRFSDWFDTATQEVEEGTSLYRYAQEIIDVQEGNC